MIEVERVVGLAFVQDAGRVGRLSEGVPRGGALVPEWLARANAAAGNGADAAGIERYGAITLRARRDVTIADERGDVHVLRDGDRLELPWDGSVRARYLAVRGGIDVPLVLGGRGTLLVASIGGLDGRPLRRGDVLSVGLAASGESRTRTLSGAGPIRVVPGPDLDVAALFESTWRLSPRSDRTGTRLEGAAIVVPSAPRTTPMIAGVIELPPSGEPIVLGPDHPTTGGYPVAGFVARVDLGRFHALPLGSTVRFERVHVDEARAAWLRACTLPGA